MSFRLLMAASLLVAAAFVPRQSFTAEKQFKEAKAEYVKATDRARQSYLAELDKLIDARTDKKKVGDLLAFRQHKNEFLLGLSTPADFLRAQGQKIGGAFAKEMGEYTVAVKDQKDKLAASYRIEIDEALKDSKTEKVAALKKEFEQLVNGEYQPSYIDLPGTPPVTLGRWVGEHKRVYPMDSQSAPDQLEIQCQEQRIRIHGVGVHDIRAVDGVNCGHFGKIVAFRPNPRPSWERAGNLYVTRQGRETTVQMLLMAGPQILETIQLDVDQGKVHDWTVQLVKKTVTATVSLEGKKVREKIIPSVPNLSIAFLATVRKPGDKMDLRVAWDDAAPAKRK